LFIDGRRQQLIGVRTTRAARGVLERRIRAAGVVRQDDNRSLDFNLKTSGWIRDVHVAYVGQSVRAGDPLFSVYSLELDALMANLLSTLQVRDQMPASRPGDASEVDNRPLETARLRLKQLDVADEEVRELEKERRLPAGLVFRSPMSGVVIDKTIVKGLRVEPGQTLFRLADLSALLVEADVLESEIPQLSRGARVDVTFDALPAERVSGRIVSTNPRLSEQRALRVIVEIPNPHDRIKAGMYAIVEIATMAGEGVLVPVDVVVDSGTSQFVFVAEGKGRFEPRRVRVGARANGQVLVLDGLREGEDVVIRGAFFLDSESRMTAGVRDYAAVPAGESSGDRQLDRTGPRVVVEWSSTPDPPRAGSNDVEVHITDSNGRPVVDANVDARLSMPAMPAMSMPAISADARLQHVGDGVYRGTASLSMAGRWDLRFDVRRDNRLVHTEHATLLAR
jgi:RND family efflux transporter MFP subunit